MKTDLERCLKLAKINDLGTQCVKKKNYRLRFSWNSQKWSFWTISWRGFWLEINRGPLLLKPSRWTWRVLQNPPIVNKWWRGQPTPRLYHSLRIPIITAPGWHPVGGFWPTSHVCRDGVRSRGPRLISNQNLRRDIVQNFHFWTCQPNRSL